VPATKKKAIKSLKTKKVLPVKSEKKLVKGHSAVSTEKKADKLVTIDRRTSKDRRAADRPTVVQRQPLERRAKVNRRRQIDPTTCERDYTLEEIEFMRALDDYKRANGRMFPTCSEVLEVIHKLGYEKRSAPAPVVLGEMAGMETSSSLAAV
jgi:hypothetical protein